jgi:hypothetical protein
MKKKMKTLICASTASVLAFATLAQASPESNRITPVIVRPRHDTRIG